MYSKLSSLLLPSFRAHCEADNKLESLLYIRRLAMNSSQPDSLLFWQDEILQVMYWMLGEGLGNEVTVADLRRLLDTSDEMLEAALQRLSAISLVRLAAPGAYQLTETGVVEGRRRFVDEFEGMLRQGHYECKDPDCDCHSPEFAGSCKAHLPHSHDPHEHGTGI
jgi:hypothetical protein